MECWNGGGCPGVNTDMGCNRIQQFKLILLYVQHLNNYTHEFFIKIYFNFGDTSTKSSSLILNIFHLSIANFFRLVLNSLFSLKQRQLVRNDKT